MSIGKQIFWQKLVSLFTSQYVFFSVHTGFPQNSATAEK